MVVNCGDDTAAFMLLSGLLLPELVVDAGLEDGNDDGENGLAVVNANDDFVMDRKFDDGSEDGDELLDDDTETNFLCAEACSDDATDESVTFDDEIKTSLCSENAPWFCLSVSRFFLSVSRFFLSVCGLKVFTRELAEAPVGAATAESTPALASPNFPGSNLALRS